MHERNPFTPQAQRQRARWTHRRRHMDPRWRRIISRMANNVEAIHGLWQSWEWPFPGWGVLHMMECLAQLQERSIFEERHDSFELRDCLGFQAQWLYAEGASWWHGDPLWVLDADAGKQILEHAKSLEAPLHAAPDLPAPALYVALPPLLETAGRDPLKPHHVIEGVYFAESWTVPSNLLGQGDRTPDLIREATPTREVLALWVGTADGLYLGPRGEVEVNDVLIPGPLPIAPDKRPGRLDAFGIALLRAISGHRGSLECVEVAPKAASSNRERKRRERDGETLEPHTLIRLVPPG